MSFMSLHPLLVPPLETAGFHLGNAKSVRAVRVGAVKIEHGVTASSLPQGQLRIGRVRAGTCGAKHSARHFARGPKQTREFNRIRQPIANSFLQESATSFPSRTISTTPGRQGRRRAGAVFSRENVGGSRRRDLIACSRFKLANREFE